MSETLTEHPSPSPSTARAVRGLLIYLAVALPLAAALFLVSADLFDAYHGTAACHRPLAGSDGADDQVMRFVLVRPGASDLELELPTQAFAGYDIPRCPRGIPSSTLPDGVPEVHKSAFELQFSVAEKPWPTTTPADLFFPLVLLVLGLPLRNFLVTGSPFPRPQGRASAPQALTEPGAPPHSMSSTHRPVV
jgi:hypothetical protein